MASADNITRNKQVVGTLTGPVTAAGLLGLLQAAFPDTAWDAATLDSVLTTGAKQGRYWRLQCSPVVVWDLRTDMLDANPNNEVYALSSPRVRQTGCESATTSVFSTFYEPALPNPDGCETGDLTLIGGR